MDQVKMYNKPIHFVVPGNLNTPTGGYHYDRKVLAQLRQLGWAVETLTLSETFPQPTAAALREAQTAFARLPDNAAVLIDGLAFGVLADLAELESERLHLIALCHHPLAFETGLSADVQAALHASEQRALAAARAVIVTSHHTAQLLTTHFGVTSDRITVVLPGTDRQPFAPCLGDPPCLFTLASLTRRKGHDVLLQALAELTDLPWHARWVGSPDLDPQWCAHLTAQIARLGLSNRVDCVGAVANPWPELQQADVFVLPSRFEGYGMVFAEALAAGLPIIAAHAGAVPDVVPASAGVLVPPDDATALAQALRVVLTDSAKRHALQLGAQQAAAELPSWQEAGQRILGVLSPFLEGGVDRFIGGVDPSGK